MVGTGVASVTERRPGVTSGTLRAVTAADGPAALPRQNGELVFRAPWESRAFGVAIALHEAGAIDYEVFRSRLIDEIAGITPWRQ